MGWKDQGQLWRDVPLKPVSLKHGHQWHRPPMPTSDFLLLPQEALEIHGLNISDFDFPSRSRVHSDLAFGGGTAGTVCPRLVFAGDTEQ